MYEGGSGVREAGNELAQQPAPATMAARSHPLPRSGYVSQDGSPALEETVSEMLTDRVTRASVPCTLERPDQTQAFKQKSSE